MNELSEWMHELDTGVRQAHRTLSPGTRPDPVVCNDCSVCIVTYLRLNLIEDSLNFTRIYLNIFGKYDNIKERYFLYVELIFIDIDIKVGRSEFL